MTLTVIALVTINEAAPEALAAYLKVTGPLLEAANAKIVKRFEVCEVVVGHHQGKMALIVEYPDRAAMDMVFESCAYKDIIWIREKAFLDYHVSIVADIE